MQKQQQKEKEPSQGGWKEKEEGMEKQGLLPCIVLPLIPPLLHTKTFDTFQWLSPTLPVTPTQSGLHKLTHIHRLTDSTCFLTLSTLLVRQHEICPSLEVGALVCHAPTSPSSSLSSILHGPALLWGPIRPLCRLMACG